MPSMLYKKHKDTLIVQTEGLSVARAQGINREKPNAFFKLPVQELEKNI